MKFLKKARMKFSRLGPLKILTANIFDRGHKVGVSRQRQRRASQREAGTELALASGRYRQDEKGRLVRA